MMTSRAEPMWSIDKSVALVFFSLTDNIKKKQSTITGKSIGAMSSLFVF